MLHGCPKTISAACEETPDPVDRVAIEDPSEDMRGGLAQRAVAEKGQLLEPRAQRLAKKLQKDNCFKKLEVIQDLMEYTLYTYNSAIVHGR